MKAVLTSLALVLLAQLALALVPGADPELGPAIHKGELDVHPSLTRFERGSMEVLAKPGIEQFFARHSLDWDVFWDDRADRPHLIQGRGVPMVPGQGNDLEAVATITIADVEQRVRAFMAEFPELFDVAQGDLVLNPQTSFQSGREGHLWFVELGQYHQGVPIRGAYVFFRINHGNLVQFGANLVDRVRTDTVPHLDGEDALVRALAAGGFDADAVTEVVHPGELKIIPMLPAGETPGHEFVGSPGQGYRHLLVREVSFRVAGDDATYQALVDAHNGRVLELVDANAYSVRGGIYPRSPNDTEVTRDFQFVQQSEACTQLNGIYLRINDNCGAINACDCDDGSCDGIIDLGMSGGDNCTTPGYGGAGNTHASRNCHYHTTNVNRVAAGYLPGNSWLNSKVTCNVNINNTCNAYWNGSTINFYRSGGGCGNTGEIAAVMVHEWGHGLDSNTGGPAPGDSAASEAFGDAVAAIYLEDPCIGPSFLSSNCYNCTDCTGVRDIADFSYHDGTATIASPATIESDTGIDCDRWTCPYYGYGGPMGYHGHCESYIASTAVWDLGVELRTKLGNTDGWAKLEEIWYNSITTSQSAYRIVSGGQCNPNAIIDGCASTNWFQAFLVADDDDGNLANGTPNCNEIWDAFNYHGIACGTRERTCPIELFDEVPVVISADTGEELLFFIEVPEDQCSLDIEISGSDPDADLYVRYGAPPTTATYDCRPYLIGSTESCHFDNPAAGLWYVMVRAYSAFTDVTLIADYDDCSCYVNEGFEVDDGGWTTGGTCTRGSFVRGTPNEVIDGGVTTQPDGARKRFYALFTAPNTSPGVDDVDGGECYALSPVYKVAGDQNTLTVSYFHGQRDTGDDPFGDSFYLEVSINGGAWEVLAFNGDTAANAVWTDVTREVSDRDQVQLRIRAADGTVAGDLIEAGIDNVTICGQETFTLTQSR